MHMNRHYAMILSTCSL